MIWYVRSHLGGIEPCSLPQNSHLILKVQKFTPRPQCSHLVREDGDHQTPLWPAVGFWTHYLWKKNKSSDIKLVHHYSILCLTQDWHLKSTVTMAYLHNVLHYRSLKYGKKNFLRNWIFFFFFCLTSSGCTSSSVSTIISSMKSSVNSTCENKQWRGGNSNFQTEIPNVLNNYTQVILVLNICTMTSSNRQNTITVE